MENLTLDALKAELEKKTSYRFIKTINILDYEVLELQGLDKKAKIDIKFLNYTTSGKRFISVNGSDRRKGYEGFGNPNDSIEEVIKDLDRHAPRYGWVNNGEQLKLF